MNLPNKIQDYTNIIPRFNSWPARPVRFDQAVGKIHAPRAGLPRLLVY